MTALAAIDEDVGLGLLATAFTLGLRHGFDWDHIAAIGDLSGAAENKRRGFVLAMLYALGHAIVVFALGTAAIAFGLAIPEGFDVWMGRVVGVTLILLGAWILIELIRKGRNFRLQSRWMLMISGTFAGLRKVRQAAAGRTIDVRHEHPHEHVIDPRADDPTNEAHKHDAAHDHSHDGSAAVGAAIIDEELLAATAPRKGWPSRRHGHQAHNHRHGHRHQLALPNSPDVRYRNGTATGIGMLHGVGIESPTQIAIFVASTAAVGVQYGLILLASWVVGLLVANAIIAALVGAGLLHAEKSFRLYATLAVVISVMSIALGIVYLIGLDILPGILI